MSEFHLTAIIEALEKLDQTLGLIVEEIYKVSDAIDGSDIGRGDEDTMKKLSEYEKNH